MSVKIYVHHYNYTSWLAVLGISETLFLFLDYFLLADMYGTSFKNKT